jgi:hypothetical protein
MQSVVTIVFKDKVDIYWASTNQRTPGSQGNSSGRGAATLAPD